MTYQVTHPNLHLTNLFRALVSQIMTAANGLQFESALTMKCAVMELLNLTALILKGRQAAAEPNKTGRPRFMRQKIIRHCQELEEKRTSELFFVKELAAACGVSERTLRTAFNENFGTGPAHYFQLRQLHQVNRVLRASDPETKSVTDILVENGIWDFGRFASRHLRLFGKRPSKTLRTKRH